MLLSYPGERGLWLRWREGQEVGTWKQFCRPSVSSTPWLNLRVSLGNVDGR